MKKLISVITAAAAVAAISATAGAYSINKDLGFGWSTSATIGAEEFANVTPDTTVTITYNEHKHPNQYTKGADDEGAKNKK